MEWYCALLTVAIGIISQPVIQQHITPKYLLLWFQIWIHFCSMEGFTAKSFLCALELDSYPSMPKRVRTLSLWYFLFNGQIIWGKAIWAVKHCFMNENLMKVSRPTSYFWKIWQRYAVTHVTPIAFKVLLIVGRTYSHVKKESFHRTQCSPTPLLLL